MNHAITRSVWLSSALLVLPIASGAMEIASDFEVDLEGWTAFGGILSHQGSGGSPGGFLEMDDSQTEHMTVYAPPKFLGDLGSFLGGQVSFDGKNINSVAPDAGRPPWFGTVTFTGPAGSASLSLSGDGNGHPPRDGQWHAYSATLDPSLWTGNLATVLADVSQVSVVLEFNNIAGREIAGFDNFVLSAVPEPASMALLSLGLGALLLRARRRQNAA